MMNMHSKRSKKILAAVLVIFLILAMIVPMFLSIL